MTTLLFIGLGRIGLPQALVFARTGFHVIGYDHDTHIARTLTEKKSPFYEPKLSEYLHVTIDNTFYPTSNWDDVQKKLSEIDAIFFTLGTTAPDSRLCLEEKELNLDTIQTTLQKIFESSFKKGVVLIFRTTLPLGSIDRLKKYIETQYPLTEGVDFHLSFVPERLIEGQAIQEEESLPKIVGTYNEAAFSIIKNIFNKLSGKIIRVADPKTAEFCKLTDNSFRNTLFAFANEVAMHAAENKIDVNEVIDAVNTEYARNTIQKPGFVSGYCLGKDPYIFEYGFNAEKNNRNDLRSLWYYGRRTNDHLIDYVVNKIIEKVKSVRDPIITILGLSFKEDVDDFRMSHAIQIIQKLSEQGVQRFKVFDPNLGKNKYTMLPDYVNEKIIYQSHYLNEDLFRASHAVLIAHRHADVVMLNKRKNLTQLLSLMEKPAYLFDAWNVWREACGIVSVEYDALGYGGL